MIEFIRFWWHSRRCPHSNLRGIYGDEIIQVGYLRLQCLDCYRFLAGPVRIADERTI